VCFSLQPFELTFTAPITILGNPLKKRQGLLLINSQTNIPISECSPLPGLNDETIDDCIQFFKDHGTEINNYLSCVDAQLTIDTPPSLRFSLDSFKETRLAEDISFKLKLNSLSLTINNKPNIAETIKIKVGRLTIEEDIDTVKKLTSKSKIRFDANRAWTLKDALLFYEATSHLNIDYIEEPLADISQLETFYKMTGCPIALDETINIDKMLEFDFSFISTFVIKPSRFGSITELRKLKKKWPNKQFIFSSSFETEVGLLQIAKLAHEFSPYSEHGLNTLCFFKKHLTNHQIITNNVLNYPVKITLKECLPLHK
jgi:o-succinylbenzoate synthase